MWEKFCQEVKRTGMKVASQVLIYIEVNVSA
jgi:hypothetical protein